LVGIVVVEAGNGSEAPTGATLAKGVVSKYLYRLHPTIGITGAIKHINGRGTVRRASPNRGTARRTPTSGL